VGTCRIQACKGFLFCSAAIWWNQAVAGVTSLRHLRTTGLSTSGIEINMKKENGKVKERMKEITGPVVDPAAAQQLNMMVLKRYDSDIEEVGLIKTFWMFLNISSPLYQQVLANSAHVTLYTLNVDTRTWVSTCISKYSQFGVTDMVFLQSRKQVEGSLFLLRRKNAPRHQLMVLNKLSTGNQLPEPMTGRRHYLQGG
jgi:hypothetical protein